MFCDLTVSECGWLSDQQTFLAGLGAWSLTCSLPFQHSGGEWWSVEGRPSPIPQPWPRMRPVVWKPLALPGSLSKGWLS